MSCLLVLAVFALVVLLVYAASHKTKVQARTDQDVRDSLRPSREEIQRRNAAPPPLPDSRDVEPPPDAWGGWMDWESSVPVTARIHIAYVDSEGQQTERDVTVTRFGDEMILGHCHLRNANRTFLFSRIHRMVDLETGELVRDGRAFLHARYLASPQGQIDQAFERLNDPISILLYVAKADGRMLGPERGVIRAFIAGHSEGLALDDEDLDGVLKKLYAPSTTEFKACARRVASQPEDFRVAVMDAAREIVGTQKKVDPMEEAALRILDAAFKLEPQREM